MRLRHVDRLHEFEDRSRQRGQIARAYIFGRTAVAWQVERDHAVPLTQERRDEQPVVKIAAEAVDQDDRPSLVIGARLKIADRPSAHFHHARLGGCRLGFPWSCSELGAELFDEGVNLGVWNRRIGDDGDQRADRQILLLLRDMPAQDAGGRAFISIGDLGRLDVGDLLADRDRNALRLEYGRGRAGTG